MKKENKVLLKVFVEKRMKKWVEKTAKDKKMSEAEVIRVILREEIHKK